LSARFAAILPPHPRISAVKSEKLEKNVGGLLFKKTFKNIAFSKPQTLITKGFVISNIF
jgi:hypothetical protein